MRYLIDAQLPRRMAGWFGRFGCDVLHTLDLRHGNRTTDEQVIEFAERDDRVLVTKDSDFVNSHLLQNRPTRLLLVSTGNISNRELEALTVPLIPDIDREFQAHLFLELGQAGITVRG